ncbi:DHH family phosphoesterase [Christensenella timonensis]|uniref:DHH family phosphoesterase n=1 Tax=Christensenella timonensis TaxID=1816678 RepID=UPI00082A8801|nr:bifunctional oligoribonuclease/PAP phosphatase NrnA [Christensenella timonensis]
MKEVIGFIKEHENFAILTHLHPDGDALGSAYALARGLDNLGKKAEVILLSEPPKKLAFEEFKPLYRLIGDVKEEAYDAAISVDCATLPRLSDAQEIFLSKPNCNIDHHISNTDYGKVNYVEEAAATGEIIFELLGKLGIDIDRTTAMAIYMAIATDSGNFTYSNTTEKTLATFSQLMQCGFPLVEMADQIFNRRSLGATKLIARFIDKMRFAKDGRLAVSVITLSDLEETGALVEDCEILINYAREVDGVEIAVFVREMSKDTYKVSFRSNDYADVGAMAAQCGGGGHTKAAGCMMKGNIYDILERIDKSAENHLQ